MGRAGLVLALLLAVTVAGPVGAAPARGKSARPAKEPTPAPADPLEKVRALAQEAQTRFETADYAGAIELWTQAYAGLPEEPRYGQQRSALAYQIAQACVEAYAIDPKLSYLRKAERLFDSYLPLIEAGDRETRAEVEKTLGELRGRIAEAEALERRQREAEVEQREAEAAAARRREEAAAEERARAVEARRREDAARERERERRRALTIAGGVVLGVGALGLGAMGYGLASGAAVDRRGDAARAGGEADPEVYRELLREGMRANRVAIVSGVVGGALVVTGAGLLGAGLRGGGRGRRELTWSPRWIPGGGGVVMFGRF